MEKLYSIGELAKIVSVSADALRYYDEIGLVKPHSIEPRTKYRYYTDDQIIDLAKIMELKRFGFSLDAIRKLLKNKDSESGKLDFYKTQYQELENEEKRIHQAKRELSARIKELENNWSAARTVLTVHDIRAMLLFSRDSLERAGYKIIGEAETGEEAIRKYTELRPDLVMVDIYGQEEMSGLDILRELGKIDANVRAVIFSQDNSAAHFLECLYNGALGYLTRPIYMERNDRAIALERAYTDKNGFNQKTVKTLLDYVKDIGSAGKELSQDDANTLMEICRDESSLTEIPEILKVIMGESV